MTIDHQYSSRTFLAVTVQSNKPRLWGKLKQLWGKLKLRQNTDRKMLCFNTSERLVNVAFLTVYIFHLIIVL